MNILLADDDPWNRRFLTRALTRLGHEVAVAADGEELLRMARAGVPDLVLSDINMPHCDGITACFLLRGELPQVRVILMTGDSELAAAAAGGGSPAVLLKPFSLERLEELL